MNTQNHSRYIKKSKDFIDEILNLDDDLDEALKFEKLLADDILIKQEPEELSMAEVRDRQKKDNHNMSEYSEANYRNAIDFIIICCDFLIFRTQNCSQNSPRM